MQRIANFQFAELIREAFESIPPAIAERLENIHFFTGADPVYAGLISAENMGNVSPLSIAYCFYPENFSLFIPKQERQTTIVLPTLVEICDVVHELGHALDELIIYEHTVQPVSEYAKTDEWEAFAEAFASFCLWDYAQDPDEKTIALLERLGNCRYTYNPS